ncbi:MAG: CdaR family protein [Candidatus Dormibacteraceae bacterium]
MSWHLITNEWRLKLLGLGLAILMLGAVAFSQTKTTTVQVTVYYNNLPAGLVVLSPVDKISVLVSGPADVIASLTPASITATADLSHLKKGTAISVPIQVKSTDSRISVQTPPPVAVNVDTTTSVALDVEVRTPNQATGWSVTQAVATCGTSLDPCKVTFAGPTSVATGLKAFVTVSDPINALSARSLNQSVEFEQNGRPIDLARLTTLPPITINPSTVDALVTAKQGDASVQVTLVDASPIHYPPAGYHVTNVTVDPLTLLCTGPAAGIANLGPITLPGLDLSNATSTATIRVQIPSQGSDIKCSAAVAKVTYTIAAEPSPSPSPSP